MTAISVLPWSQNRLCGLQKAASLPLNFHNDAEKFGESDNLEGVPSCHRFLRHFLQSHFSQYHQILRISHSETQRRPKKWESVRPGLKFLIQSIHLLWTYPLSSTRLRFPLCKMGIVVVLSSSVIVKTRYGKYLNIGSGTLHPLNKLSDSCFHNGGYFYHGHSLAFWNIFP